MQALVYWGPGKLALEEADVPSLKPDEVLVQVERVGICGSELEGYLGHSSIRVPPLVMGHEFCGTIAAMGDEVRGLSLGDKVVVNPLIACRTCPSCLAGKINICRNRQLIGIHRPGAFAEFVAVPYENAISVPKEMDASLASLAEPLAVAIHAVKLGLRPLDDLLILGAGPIGLLCLLAAKEMGAGSIVVLDLQPDRLAHAERLGAVGLSPRDLDARREEIFPLGIPSVIDCVGVQAAREQAMHAVDAGGKVILVGLGHGRSDLPVNHVVRQEISLIGSYTYSHEDFQQAVALLRQGKIDIRHWTQTRDLAEGPAAFQELVEGKGSFSKIFLKP
ncbi:zinc-dependent alcohol dehydrogenase [Paenibacillus glycinis]|uniref:Alcohol dehydrogenase catalytic domain-containing protein n=1 Tax=Paenibacillus glycinis TaxID=2697035 RepID=A0ABW9XSG1_9BACL|nr:alcohol dehydrogenase catalytic domain-containing protein [Paenibacillus glycinis]NBD25606.1 alcohol dehydrogenase catalytic domain-containing protein [Paenibacillus glycinis]